jgi:hypothetical protein
MHLILLLYHDYNSFYLVDNDYILINEVINETVSGKFFSVHHLGDIEKANFLAHHFSPGLIIFIPFVLFSTTKIGYGIGLIIISLLSFIFWKLIIRKRFNRIDSIFIFSLICFNLYSYRLFTSYHFEIAIFSFSLLFFLGVYKRNIILEISGYLLAISLKEDMAIYFIFYSFYFLFKKDFKRFSYLFFISSLYYFLIIPYIRTFIDMSANENWLIGWENYGQNNIDIVIGILKNPLGVMESILSKYKIIIELYIGFSFFPIFSLFQIFAVFPLFIMHFTSTRIWYNTIYNYYSYTILAAMFISFLEGYQNVGNKKIVKKYKFAILFLIIGLVLFTSSKDVDFPRKFRPIEFLRLASVKDAISLIPKGSSVSIAFDLGALLNSDIKAYPIKEGKYKEYVLLDVKSFSPYISIEKIENELNKNLVLKKIELIYSQNGVKLYREIINIPDKAHDKLDSSEN